MMETILKYLICAVLIVGGIGWFSIGFFLVKDREDRKDIFSLGSSILCFLAGSIAILCGAIMATKI